MIFYYHQCHLISLSIVMHAYSFFFRAEDGIRDFSRDWSSDVCSSDWQAARGEASALTSTPASVAGGARATSGRRDAEPGSRRLGPVRARGKRREAPDAPHGTELEGLNILLVEDDVRSAFALTGLLERQGAAVSHAEDVSEAAERLAEGCAASALLIDAELLTSGSEGPRERMLERCGRVPIVALTSLSHAPR